MSFGNSRDKDWIRLRIVKGLLINIIIYLFLTCPKDRLGDRDEDKINKD